MSRPKASLASFLLQSLCLTASATFLPRASTSSGAGRFVKRVDPTWHSSCDAYPDIKAGWAEGLNMAQQTINVLTSDEDPFADQDPVEQNPFEKWWEPARLNLFGQNSLTSHDDMLQLYQGIASGPPVTIACQDPPNGGPDTRCDLYEVDGQDTWMYRLSLDPNDQNSDDQDQKQGYIDDKSQGFADGNNLIICPAALPSAGSVTLLANRSPQAGDPLANYRSTYGFQFVHELAHVVGDCVDNVYGMPDSTNLASQAAQDSSRPKPSTNADTWALFALAVSSVSNPPMSQYDWTGGATGENARPYQQG